MTAYCQQFGIASRVASFLVLENDNDYKRLNLEEERGKTLSGDLGEFLDDRLWQTTRRAKSSVSARRSPSTASASVKPMRTAGQLLHDAATGRTCRSCWRC